MLAFFPWVAWRQPRAQLRNPLGIQPADEAEEGAFDAQGIGTTDKSQLLRQLGRVDSSTLAALEASVRSRPSLPLTRSHGQIDVVTMIVGDIHPASGQAFF